MPGRRDCADLASVLANIGPAIETLLGNRYKG